MPGHQNLITTISTGIKKDNRAQEIDPYIYYNDTCLTGNPKGFFWGYLGVSPEQALIKTLNANTAPRTGMWLGFMDIYEV